MAVARSSRKIHQLAKRRLFHAREYWRADNERYGILLAEALFLNHYRQDNELTKDRRVLKPKTQKQFNLLRHKASILLRSMPEFDTHAVQPGADAAAAEVSLRVINNIFLDPMKGYHDARSRFVWSALAAERGVIWIDWHPKWGVCFSFGDPRRTHITPGFVFMHDPRNPLVQREVPMRMSEVQKMKAAGWDIPSDLTGDGGMKDFGESGSRDADGIERDQSSHLPGADENEQSDPLVTVCFSWWREDPFGPDNKKLANADLAEADWHFVDDQTGQRVLFDPMNPTPPPSPVTGQPMRFVTSKAEMYNQGEYDKGYLCITAPLYAGERPLFEGSWTEGALNPDATLSAFPAMELTSYKHPLRRCGISDTELTHSQVVIDNVSKRNAWDQMNATGGLIITKPGSLKNSEGNQFQFTNEPINIAYADDILAAESTKFFQAQGMNPATGQFRQIVNDEWNAIGTGDFSANLGPERSKDIAVGTANLLQQIGDLPTQLHQQDLDLQEAIGARVALDFCRAYMGDQVISWVTDEGEAAYANVRGSDLVPLNVTVVKNKEWRKQDVDRVQATAQLLGMIGKMGLPPGAIAPLLREAGLSASVVMAISDAMAQQPSAANAPPGANAPPQPGGPPALSVVQGGQVNG